MTIIKSKVRKLWKLFKLSILFDKFKNTRLNRNRCINYKRRWWVRPTNQKRNLFGFHKSLLMDMRQKDEEEFFRFTRMSVSSFDQLLDLIRHRLQKFSRRESISPDIRLLITLRHLATGDGYNSLHLLFKIGASTVQRIIVETCDALWDVLCPMLLCEPSVSEWKQISLEFEEKWNLFGCCGSVDGKHIRMQAPYKSGSKFYNYKKYYSIVLLAICDASYNFICVDVGAYGSQSDGGVFKNSIIGKTMEENGFQLPPPRLLPGTNQLFNSYFVADSAFPLTHNMITPYLQPRRGRLSDRFLYFNYRIGRGRISIENTFGILVARWRIYHTTVFAHPKTVDKIVKATIVLHNYIKTRKGDNVRYCPKGYTDEEGPNGEEIKGKWRKEVPADIFQPVVFDMPVISYKYKKAAAQNRNVLLDFISPQHPEDV